MSPNPLPSISQGRPAKNPNDAPRLTPADIAKMTPKELLDRQLVIRKGRLQQNEVEVVKQLFEAVREGVSIDGGPVQKHPIEDIVVHIIGLDDPWMLPKDLREKLIYDRGAGASVFTLRDREALAAQLHNFRLGPDAEIQVAGRNRDEKRSARAAINPYPFREHAQTLRKRPTVPSYYVVVHSAAGASVIHMGYNETEMQALLDHEAKQQADHAEREVADAARDAAFAAAEAPQVLGEVSATGEPSVPSVSLLEPESA